VLNFDTDALWEAVVSFRLHFVSADKSDIFSHRDMLFVKALHHVFVAGGIPRYNFITAGQANVVHHPDPTQNTKSPQGGF